MVHGCMVYTERAETAAVSCGTSHVSAVSTPLRWIVKNVLENVIHSGRITRERSEYARERRIELTNKKNGIPGFQTRSKDQEIKRREVELDPQVCPEEIKRREVELG